MKVFTERYLEEQHGERAVEEEIRLFKEVQKKVNALYSDEEFIPWLSCHILVDALANFFPELEPQHGYWEMGWVHAWFETPLGNIIDVYPWGTIGGPILRHRETLVGRPIYGFFSEGDRFFRPFSPDARVLGEVKARNPDYDDLVEAVCVALAALK